MPNGAGDWPPASPAPVLAEAASPRAIGPDMPDEPLVPVAAFTGRLRSLPLDWGQLEIFEGALRGVAQDEAACRILLRGRTASILPIAEALAGQLPVSVPRAGLAASALAVASGKPADPRHLGAPEIPQGADVATALALVVCHLTDVILHWAPLATSGLTPEPVHQMRVAVRRLRSALSIFRRASAGAAGEAALKEAGRHLKDLAARLGAARDWDVFLSGPGAAIAGAFEADRRIAGLLTAAERKRQAAYAALAAHLAGEHWRRISLGLALLAIARPWEQPDQDIAEGQPDARHILAAPAQIFAAHALDRLHRHLVAAGEDLSALPPEALHDVRKQGKQFRYACEFFAPLFPPKPVRRFLSRLEDLQEALGAVNDAHVAASLMGQLGGGEGRAFAAGAVLGWIAASSAPEARQAGRAWSRFLDQDGFWD